MVCLSSSLEFRFILPFWIFFIDLIFLKMWIFEDVRAL